LCPYKDKERPTAGAGTLTAGLTTTNRVLFIMADSNPTEFMSAKEAATLADNLAHYGGKHSLATRLATVEAQCRKASRLIRAMLRQVHSSDVFQLPPEE
jgi:hypothetical protein